MGARASGRSGGLSRGLLGIHGGRKRLAYLPAASHAEDDSDGDEGRDASLDGVFTQTEAAASRLPRRMRPGFGPACSSLLASRGLHPGQTAEARSIATSAGGVK